MKIDWDELKRWATDRLDYENTEIGKEHSAYGGHYFAGVLALLAEREAAQKFQKEVLRIAGLTSDLPTKEVLLFALAAFDKESKND